MANKLYLKKVAKYQSFMYKQIKKPINKEMSVDFKKIASVKNIENAVANSDSLGYTIVIPKKNGGILL